MTNLVSDQLIRLSIADVLARFRDGSLSPVSYAEAFIDVITRREPVVKAFEYLDLDAFRAAARASAQRYASGDAVGALDGIPFGIKDIIETADMPTGNGSHAFKGQQTGNDAACVIALRNAGAIIAGKMVTTEFAYGFSGVTTNPHDPLRSPGGSSSGSAAAVGAGMLPIALGTQTIGSVLRPASFNGIVGFKPTYGALSLGGVHPMAVSLDHLGTLANDVAGAWLGASVISMGAGAMPGFAGLVGASLAAPEPRRPTTLIHLHLNGWDELSAADQDTLRGVVASLRDDGITVLDRDNEPRVAALEVQLMRDAEDAIRIVDYDARFPYTGYVARYGDLIGGRVREAVARSASVRNEDYLAMLERRAAGQASTRALLTALGAQAFILPAASGAAPFGLEYTGSRTYLTYASWLGFPAISLPLMQSDGMPWGLQLMQADRQDAALIGLARWFEMRGTSS